MTNDQKLAVEAIELLGEVIRMATAMAQELQDCIDDNHTHTLTTPTTPTTSQQLLDEWEQLYSKVSHLE